MYNTDEITLDILEFEGCAALWLCTASDYVFKFEITRPQNITNEYLNL